MSTLIQHPRAVELAHKTELATAQAAQQAEEKAERAAHRKWLKETKPERDAERAKRRRIDAARAHLFGAICDAADVIANKAGDTAVVGLTEPDDDDRATPE